jgi:peptidoglycan hydrolase-like protein with peptidoglycan-binding domain
LPVLRRGSEGEEVRKLQTALKESPEERMSPVLAIDEDFGPRTEASVRSFQRRVDVPVDGVVGDQTWYAPVGGVRSAPGLRRLR